MDEVRDWARIAIECAVATRARHVMAHFRLTREQAARVREKSFLKAIRSAVPGFNKTLVTFVVTSVQVVGDEWQLDIRASFRHPTQ